MSSLREAVLTVLPAFVLAAPEKKATPYAVLSTGTEGTRNALFGGSNIVAQQLNVAVYCPLSAAENQAATQARLNTLCQQVRNLRPLITQTLDGTRIIDCQYVTTSPPMLDTAAGVVWATVRFTALIFRP